ncbi:MAG TPA: ABC transporter permease [Polyangiaceae bacterium]|jgi:putative ABC transport system permease protein|nr:ABC transporter permease [Polyangiaceae bacterium]
MNSLRFLTSTILMALSALGRWPLRALLTTFGILVGVASVTITVALGEGARAKVGAQVDKLGSNALSVEALPQNRTGAAAGGQLAILSEADGIAIKRDEASVSEVAPVLSSTEQLVFGGNNLNAEVMGTSLAFFRVRSWQTASGAVWDEAQQSIGARVCVIGKTIVDELFGDTDPVGRILRVGRHPFLIIGVMQSKGQDTFGRDEDARIWVPILAARAKLRPQGFGQVDSLVVSAVSAEASERASKAVTALLRQRHHLVDGMDDDFRIRSQGEFRQVQDRIFGVLSMLLVSVALVSLVVGGIGIMNIMLVSVSERTKEIGIRLAIGARARDILVQFLVEASVLSVLGGAAGAVAAALGVGALGNAIDVPMAVSAPALFAALLVSVLTGVGFGLWPARRAARLDPIDALRGE